MPRTMPQAQAKPVTLLRVWSVPQAWARPVPPPPALAAHSSVLPSSLTAEGPTM